MISRKTVLLLQPSKREASSVSPCAPVPSTRHRCYYRILKLVLVLFILLLFLHNCSFFLAGDDSQWLLNLHLSHRPASCRARFNYTLYSPGSGEPEDEYRASHYLMHRLRQYEKLHAACSSKLRRNSGDCRYVVWVAPLGLQGLGNKMLALVSTFLYALLSNRVLLIAGLENMDRLFCEPFPDSSWLLPKDMEGLVNETVRLGHLSRVNCTNPKSTNFSPRAYAYLSVDYQPGDRKFFCQGEQDAMHEHVRWLFVRSNVYYVPGLYYVPSFRDELELLFPQQQAIFHHLGRYLFHPSNKVRERTLRYYRAYLSGADYLAGIQMRVPTHLEDSRKDFPADVFRCITTRRILPGVSRSLGRPSGRRIAVVVTSLSQAHFDVLRDIYLEHDTEDGSQVTLHQPSHEGEQHTGDLAHDEKALMEMYLLSFSNVLITSPGSTFGYVAQGLAGLRPWLLRDEPSLLRNVCTRVTSLDPCFFAFGDHNCDCDPFVKLKNVQTCEDAPVAPGVKLKPT